jgi:hypothetical protein
VQVDRVEHRAVDVVLALVERPVEEMLQVPVARLRLPDQVTVPAS